MAQSAGKRTASPIIRFEDEFGSLGSNPTPELVEKKETDFFKTWRGENLLLLNTIFTERGFYSAHARAAFQMLNNTGLRPDLMLKLYRQAFYETFVGCPPHFHPRYYNDTEDEAFRVISYYAPYYMCSKSEVHEEFFNNWCDFDVDSMVDHYEAQPDYIANLKCVHERRVMEEVEKCALIAYSRWMVETEYDEEGDEEDFDWEYTSRQALYRIQTAFQCNPLIRRTFSKSVALNFLATAIAFRQTSLMYNIYHGRPALDFEMEDFDYDY